MDRSAGRVDGSDSVLGMRLTAHLVDALLVRKLLRLEGDSWQNMRDYSERECKSSQVCRKSLSSSGVL